MALGAVLLAGCGSHPPPPAHVMEVFEATTPCDPHAVPLPQIPAGTDCEMAIWHVELRSDGAFTLDTAYGMSQPNTTGVRDGGVNVEMRGTWATLPEPGPSGLAIVELTDPATSPVRLARISDNLLHLLDGQGRLMIGNAAWSYTLNRTGPMSPPSPAEARPISPSIGQDISGTFQGRTPCQRAIAKFLGRPDEIDCRRIKLSVQLRAIPDSPTSGEYLTNAVYVASGASGQQSGTWRQPQGAPGIIELELASGIPLRLILIDYNHLFILDDNNRALVGDAHHSYTLSRNG